MKLLIVILLALAASLAIAYVAVDDPGYVLITLQPWSVELSFSLFVVLLVALFIATYLVVRFLVRIWGTPKDISMWRKRRLKGKAHLSQTQGMMGLIEGDWPKAEKQLLSYLSHTDTPVLNFLGAAHAAQAQGDLERRDRYLIQARDSDPRQTVAVGLTKAKLQYQTGQLEQALATLKQLQTHAPKNKKILGLQMQIYQDLQDWKALSELVPAARKYRVLPADKLDQLEQLTTQRLLTHSDNGDGQLQNIWRTLSRDQKRDPELIATYVDQLIESGDAEQAEVLLRKAIKQQWEPKLVLLYGRVHSSDLAKQLKTAEKWAINHQEDPELLLTLARLCMASELWGKARSYLESCIANDGPAEAYQELGTLLEQLEEPENALAYYRQGLERVSTSTGQGQSAPPKAAEETAALTAPATPDSPLESDR
jgi:HemY protein